ncbi:unannotated protein [freshwater metagenome]|uniref:Unannotated protein n=1 Tax=freshwater metagenome TaxID=449393 RepID=A0A6J7HF80_9ZZZZ|nr:hypothetical protein [Actinomycetota bacterium]
MRRLHRTVLGGGTGFVLALASVINGPLAQAVAATVTISPASPTVSPGSTLDLTASAPIAQAGSTTQQITQEIDPTKLRLTRVSDITYPSGWTLSYCSGLATDCAVAANFSATTPANAAAWAEVKAVKATGTVDSQGENAGRQVAQASVSGGGVAQTPTTLPSSGLGLDGFKVFFDPGRTRVFNIYHHTSGAIMDCYVVLTGSRCVGFPFNYGGESAESALGVVVGSTAWIGGNGGLFCVDLAAVLANSANAAGGGSPSKCFSGGTSALVSLKASTWFQWFTGGTQLGQSAETRLYALDSTSTAAMVYCIDTATRSACGTPTINPNLVGAGNQNGNDGSNIFKSGDLLYVSIANGNVSPVTEQVTCVRISSGAKCPGWTSDDTYSSASGRKDGKFVPIPAADGSTRAVCYYRVDTTHKCWEADGTQRTASYYNFPNFNTTNSGSTYSYGVPTQIGSRVYYGNARWQDPTPTYSKAEVICFDATAFSGLGGRCNDAATNLYSTTTKNYVNYTVTPDPTIPNCLWITQHANPVFKTVNILTGDLGCSAIAPQRATFSGATAVPRMGCSATSAIQEWSSFTLDTPTSGFTSAKLTVQNSSGANITGWTDIPLTAGVPLNLSALSTASTGQTPNFLVDFQGISGSLTATARIQVIGDAPQLCTHVTAQAICPATLGPIDPAALVSGLAVVTGSGSSTAGATTTPFASSTSNVTVSAPTEAQCGSTLTGRAGDASLGSGGSAVPGAIVSLLDSSGNAVLSGGIAVTTTTSASGTYSFGYLTPGTYRVGFPATATATSTSATVVSGAAGSSLTTVSAVSGVSTSAADVLVVGTNGVVNGLYLIAAAATADTSTGKAGVAQTITPLANDTASTGATYSGGSTALKLCGAAQAYPNCTATTLVTSGQGSYSVSGTTVTFTPCTGVNTPVMTPACTGAFTGTASAVSYQSTDSLGRTATSTITPTVVPAPVTVNDTSTGAWNTPQSISPLANDLRGNAYDSSYPLLSSSMGICLGSVTLATSCTGTTALTTADGTYSLNTSTGVVTFTPNASFTGVVTAPIKYAAADSLGQRVIASITPTVTAPPVPTAASESKVVSAGTSVSFTTLTGSSGLATPGTTSGPSFTTAQTFLCGVSPAETPPTCTKTSITVAGGTYTLNQTTGVVTFAANANASPGAQTAISYVVKDALGRTANATLTPTVPGPPTVVADTGTGSWDTNQTYSPLANDSSATSTLVTSSLKLCGISPTQVSPNCTQTSLTVAGQGTYTVNAGGTVTFDPLPTFAVSGTTAATAVSYQVSDANGLTSSTTITPTVNPPANPTAADQSKTVIAGQTATFSPLIGAGGLSTSGGPALSTACLLVSGTCDADGSVVISGEGTWALNPSTLIPTFTPCSAVGVPDASCAGPFSGTPTPLSYRVTDAVGHTATGVLTPTIPPSPTAVDDVSRGEQDSTQTASLLANDAAGTAAAPLNASSLKICAIGSTPCTGIGDVTTANGSYHLNANGTVTFTPNPGYSGTDTGIAYTVSDSLGRSGSATYTPTVLPTPAPIAYPDAKSGAYGSNIALTPLTSANSSSADSAGTQPANTSTTYVTGLALDSATLKLCSSGQVPPNCTATSVTTVDGTYTLSGSTVTFAGASGFSGTAAAPITYQVANTYTTTVINPSSTTTSGPTTTDPTAACAATPGCTVNVVNDADGTAPNGVGGTTPGYTPTWTTTQAAVVSTTVGSQVASSTITPTITVAAVAALPNTATTPWNTPVTASVLADDTFAGTLASVSSSLKLCGPNDAGTCAQTSVTISGQGTYDIVTVGGVQQVTFTPLASFTGTATAVTYAAVDPLGRTVSSTFTPTVSEPIGPTAAPDTKSVIAGGSVNFATLLAGQGKVSAGDNSVQNAATCLLDPGTTSCASSNTVVTAHGTYVLDTSTGIVRFTASSSAPSGALTAMQYRVTDSFGMTSTSTLTPTVYQRPNVLPVTNADLVNTTQSVANLLAGATKDSSATLASSALRLCDLAGGDVVPDCAATTVTLAGYGTFVLDPSTGAVVFTPVTGFTGTVPVLDYSVTDSLGQKAYSTITVTVNPLPEPVATNDAASGTVGDTLTFQPDTNDSAGTNSASISGLTLDPTSIRLCDVMPNAQTPPHCSATSVTTADGTYTLDPSTGAVTFVGAVGFSGTATNPVRYQISNSYSAGGTPGSATTSALLIPTLTPQPANGRSSEGSDGNSLAAEPSVAPGADPATPATDPASSAGAGPKLQPQRDTTFVNPGAPVVLDPLADATPTPGSTFKPSSVRIWDGNSWETTVTEPGVGTWTVIRGKVEFLPARGYTGTAIIRVRATDTAGARATSSLKVIVQPRNAAASINRPATTKVPTAINAGVVMRTATCPSPTVGGKPTAWITLGGRTIPVKNIALAADGSLTPPASNLVAGLSTDHAALGAKVGTSVISWHVRYGSGCDGALNSLLTAPVGTTFTVKPRNGAPIEYRITEQLTVPKGTIERKWFSAEGPHRLTLLTCNGLKNGEFTQTTYIGAEPVQQA